MSTSLPFTLIIAWSILFGFLDTHRRLGEMNVTEMLGLKLSLPLFRAYPRLVPGTGTPVYILSWMSGALIQFFSFVTISFTSHGIGQYGIGQ